jgi:TolB-like protein
MLRKGSILLFCFGLFIITSCASTSSPSPSSSQRAPTPPKREVKDLTAKDVKAAISNHQHTIVDSITEHTGTSGRPGVAVLDIASDNNELGVFATEEIILQLVRTRKFRVVDRDSIETILKEHHFQYSGVVNDETAVSIGKFIGASIIITGVIRQRDGQIDFSLKILDVETAEIVDLISIPIWE